MCFRFIEAPEQKEKCFIRRTSYAVAGSISASNKTVAIISGDGFYSKSDHLQLIDVQTGSMRRIGMRW